MYCIKMDNVKIVQLDLNEYNQLLLDRAITVCKDNKISTERGFWSLSVDSEALKLDSDRRIVSVHGVRHCYRAVKYTGRDIVIHSEDVGLVRYAIGAIDNSSVVVVPPPYSGLLKYIRGVLLLSLMCSEDMITFKGLLVPNHKQKRFGIVAHDLLQEIRLTMFNIACGDNTSIRVEWDLNTGVRKFIHGDRVKDCKVLSIYNADLMAIIESRQNLRYIIDSLNKDSHLGVFLRDAKGGKEVLRIPLFSPVSCYIENMSIATLPKEEREQLDQIIEQNESSKTHKR